MTDEKIKRINELYHKSKKEGLTPEEIKQQADLRREYIASVRKNLTSSLRNVSLLEPDGSVTDLGKIIDAKEKRGN